LVELFCTEAAAHYFLQTAARSSSYPGSQPGPHGAIGYSRLRPRVTGYSRQFVDKRTGYDRLASGRPVQHVCTGPVDEEGNSSGC
jgi:hypothetical protein